MSSHASADRAHVVRPRRSRSHPSRRVALAELDRRVLAVLCDHRVVRQDQLQRLFPEVPERTLRYRTRRLHDLGLAGRSRPYRDRGSAPSHHWLTRRADCLMRGDPLPRGGERQQPNPLFLAHAATLTELYVTLATGAHTAGLRLLIYRREGEARETFKDGARERTLAPDAMVVLTDDRDRKLGAFVEIDLGTMSHARLRFKAGLYAAYAKFAWTKVIRHQMVRGTASPDDPALIKYWAARRRKAPPPPIGKANLRLYEKQQRRCPICGDWLLSTEDPPQNPREWAHWLTMTRKATIQVAMLASGTSDVNKPRLIHAHCHRRCNIGNDTSPALPPAPDPKRLA